MIRLLSLTAWLCTILGLSLLVCSVVLVPEHSALLYADDGDPPDDPPADDGGAPPDDPPDTDPPPDDPPDTDPGECLALPCEINCTRQNPVPAGGACANVLGVNCKNGPPPADCVGCNCLDRNEAPGIYCECGD